LRHSIPTLERRQTAVGLQEVQLELGIPQGVEQYMLAVAEEQAHKPVAVIHTLAAVLHLPGVGHLSLPQSGRVTFAHTGHIPEEESELAQTGNILSPE